MSLSSAITAEIKRRATTTPNDAIAQSAIAQQLALGNNQWIDLFGKVREIIRVGTDTRLTLADMNAVEVLVTLEGLAGAVAVQYNAAWIQGTYGPDVGQTGLPYVYCYRYRASSSGAISNPSPASRGGVLPRRQRVTLTGTQSPDIQVDLVDWFVYGGQLTGWTFVGTSPNSATPTFDVVASDSAIEGGGTLSFDQFQPWPLSDLPRTGTCAVAGTAVQWLSGDAFNLNWAPGTLIMIGDTPTTIYGVTSAAQLHVTTNCGSGTGLTWTIREPVLLGQPLPTIWGGPVNGVWFHFACGDANDPTVVRWTRGNDPDTTSDAYWLSVCPATEQMQNGLIYNGQPVAFSSGDLYLLVPQFGNVLGAFRAQPTGCGKGLWSRWALCGTPEGIYFLSDDGIYRTTGGPAQSITDADLRRLFPHDGIAGQAANGIDPPDLSRRTALRLTYVNTFVYFDYQTVAGVSRTLVFEPATSRWFYDTYPAGVVVSARVSEPGAGVENHLIGTSLSTVVQYDPAALLDVGAALAWAFQTPQADGGDPRTVKQFGDLVLHMDPAYSVGGITVQPLLDNATVVLPASTIGIGSNGQDIYIVDLQAGDGVLAANLGLRISGTLTPTDTARPTFDYWAPTYVAKSVSVARRATDWDDLGYAGAKFVQGLILRANTYGQNKTLRVEYDGGVLGVTLTINHDGELAVAYPLASAGWTPFVAELVRVIGADDVEWTLLGARFVYEPAPEAATTWETQWTSHDCPGYLSILEEMVAYQATAKVTVAVDYAGGTTVSGVFPASGGVYARDHVLFPAGKGRAVRYRWTSDAPFRLFKRDCAVQVVGWGMAPSVQSPFGGPHRVDGAAI